MIGPVGPGLVARTAATARVKRRALDVDDTATQEGASVGLEETARPALRAIVPGFDDSERGEDPRPAGRRVAAGALSAILGLKRGG